MAEQQSGLTPDEIDVFARGLYYLANIDGIADREQSLITEFIQETGADIKWEDLQSSSFSAYEAAQVLETSYLRRIFIKTAIALVKADGVYSDNERRALGDIADIFGLSNADFGALEQDAAKNPLS